MSKKLVIGVVSLVFAAVIITLFMPALKVDSSGYEGVKVDKAPSADVEVAAAPKEEQKPPVEVVVEEPEAPAPTPAPASVSNSESTSSLYSVVDGDKLDAESYAGFKLYRNWCARCHGTYAQGMIGPNLATSLKSISKEEFFATVENGKAGSIGSMPAWKANPKVMAGRDKLYAYLMARSDGAIGQTKPKKQ